MVRIAVILIALAGIVATFGIDKIDEYRTRKWREKKIKEVQERHRRYKSGYKVHFREATNKYNDIY